MISEAEWSSISNLVTRIIGQSVPRRHFITGVVVKNDTNSNLVWVKELGAQPIPVVGFDYDVKSYDTDSSGNVTVRHFTATPKTPEVGQHVVIALELGEAIPRCLGIVQGQNWIVSEES